MKPEAAVMKKQTVFILVEGISDKLALQGLFDSYFRGHNLYIHVEGGDITTKIWLFAICGG